MSSNSYASLCDDFGASMYLASKVELPTSRDTVLHFFDSVRKLYPKMTDFEKRDARFRSRYREPFGNRMVMSTSQLRVDTVVL